MRLNTNQSVTGLKIFKRTIQVWMREKVQIDNMQFGCMGGKGTTFIFIIRQLLEKYVAKQKWLKMAFFDLEKAFDQVPCGVVW